MSYIALYRKWRPLVFEDVVEQEHVVKTLKYSVSTGRIAHAYLFCGTRGTGKTTTAHILSRAINCLQPRGGNPCNECEICRGILSGTILDVLEIDAASNNSVDNIRDIRDDVIYSPSTAKYKVYIIDEVHMLSSGAFNALLKTLEEPPEHVVFILATTEPHKLPATILSRCQRYDFRRITVGSIAERLRIIAGSLGVTVEDEALKLMAKLADGALRDAISLLDQCVSQGGKEISYNDVLSVVGIVNDSFLAEVVDSISSRDVKKALDLVEKLVMNGKDISQFVSDLVLHYRNLLICKISDNPREIIEVSPEMLEVMKRQCSALHRDEIVCIIKELSLLESGLKWSAHPRITLEVCLIKLCEGIYGGSNDEILGRLSILEDKLSSMAAGQRQLPGENISPVEAQGSSDAVDQAKGAKTRAASAHGNAPVHDAAPAPTGASLPPAPTDASLSPAPPSASVSETAAPQARDVHGGVKHFESWEKMLGELKSSGRMALYTYLHGTKAVELGNNALAIVSGSAASLNKMFSTKPENMRLLEEMARKYLGREVRIKCIEEEDIAYAKDSGRENEEDDLLETAKKLAGKCNAPINIIDG